MPYYEISLNTIKESSFPQDKIKMGGRKMQYSSAQIFSVTLDELVEVVPRIYSRIDKRRSVFDVLCHTCHHAAGIAEEIQNNSPVTSIFEEIADCFFWLLTLVHKIHGTIDQNTRPNEIPEERTIRIQNTCSDLLWNRYPGVCPGCYWRRKRNSLDLESLLKPCDCQECFEQIPANDIRNLIQELTMFAQNRLSSKPATLDGWQDHFSNLFHIRLHKLSVSDMAFHFLISVGKLADAIIRMYTYTEKTFIINEPALRQAKLEGSIADVLAELFLIVQNLDSSDIIRALKDEITTKPIRISKLIWRRYGSEKHSSFYCPSCRSQECTCPLIFVPYDHSMKELMQLTGIYYS
jgi:NTP pyrophosphatase (non-canonical NTP hydrolase)